MQSASSIFSLPPLLHAQDLNHPDEDVQEVQLKADTLVNHVLVDSPSLSQSGMLQDLLCIVECEASEDGQAAIQPDTLAPHQSARCGSGEDERGEAADSDKSDTGEERSAEIEVFFLLSRCADKGKGAHHGNCVESCASEDGGLHEEERG